MFLILTAGIASQILAQSASGGAPITPATQSADDSLRDCSQMLDQSIAEVRALKAYVRTLEELRRVTDELLSTKDTQIREQAKLIAAYEKRKGLRISFLFGLVKISKN